MVYTHGGRRQTDLEVSDWAKEAVRRGAGEILLTSMDADGEKTGFEHRLTKLVSEAVTVPVIASGGAGNAQHMLEAFTKVKLMPHSQPLFSIIKKPPFKR